MDGKKFSVWMNRDFLLKHAEYQWIKNVSSKSVKKSIEDANIAFQRFFKGQSKFPRFKKKGKADVKMYFVRNNKGDCCCDRHRINIPTLGWVRVKEKGYIPTTRDGFLVRSGTVSIKAGRYYVSVIVDVPKIIQAESTENGMGIDLGIKHFAVCSNGKFYPNINKKITVKKLEKKLRRAQRCLARKYKNLKKGESARKTNIQKQKLKVQMLYCRLSRIRTDYINKTIAEIVKTKPSYIAIENLNISGMMKNRYLARAISSQKFYEFRVKMKKKGEENGIELRIVDRFYPSSKKCHCCGRIKNNLKITDRIFFCDCGYTANRDLNAALNLKDAEIYKIA